MLSFRQLNKDDLDKVYSLFEVVESVLPNRQFWMKVTNRDKDVYLNESTYMYGAFDGDELVATSFMLIGKCYKEDIEVLRARSHVTAEIDRCAVHPDYRGNNLMLKLNTHLEDIAKERGVASLFATVHPQNIQSWSVFRRQGFVRIRTGLFRDTYLRDVLIKRL